MLTPLSKLREIHNDNIEKIMEQYSYERTLWSYKRSFHIPLPEYQNRWMRNSNGILRDAFPCPGMLFDFQCKKEFYFLEFVH